MRNLPFTDLFFSIKSVRLTTNMDIFRKIKIPSSDLYKDVSLLIYAIYRTGTFKVKVRGLCKRIKEQKGNSPYLKVVVL